MKEGKEGNVWFNLSVYTEEERGISEGLHPSLKHSGVSVVV